MRHDPRARSRRAGQRGAAVGGLRQTRAGEGDGLDARGPAAGSVPIADAQIHLGSQGNGSLESEAP